MILQNEYLTDEELEQLISEVEADELITAPPELKESIVNAIFEQVHHEPGEIVEKEQIREGDVPNPPPEICRMNKNSRPTDVEQIAEIKKRKRREFAGYCFRVAMSVAAAVAFVFIMPYLPGFGDSEDIMQQPGIIENSSVNQSDIPGWEDEDPEEGKKIEEQDYPTKEEVLNETNILHRMFGGNNIFTGNINLNIFTEKDGGQ